MANTPIVFITPAAKHRNPDVGALLAAPRLGGASAAPTIDMFNCRRNKMVLNVVCMKPSVILFIE
jgi:hypothetical protein